MYCHVAGQEQYDRWHTRHPLGLLYFDLEIFVASGRDPLSPGILGII